MNDDQRVEQLARDGACVVPRVLDQAMLREMQTVSDELTAAMSEDERAKHKYTGSLISLHDDERFAKLINWPGTIEAFAGLGLTDLTWMAGYVISKPPHNPSLFWHQDWWAWDDPISYQPQTKQYFAMYYLVDTTRHNGCLRMIPGTHTKHHPLHDKLAAAHTDAVYEATQNGPEHASYDDEVDVPVQAGDLVIGDARVLHAAHANNSAAPRPVLTLWYLPQIDKLSQHMRDHIGNLHLYRCEKIYKQWSQEAVDTIRPLLPTIPAEYAEPEFQRTPHWELQV